MQSMTGVMNGDAPSDVELLVRLESFAARLDDSTPLIPRPEDAELLREAVRRLRGES